MLQITFSRLPFSVGQVHSVCGVLDHAWWHDLAPLIYECFHGY